MLAAIIVHTVNAQIRMVGAISPLRALPSLREKRTGIGGHDGQQSERGARDVGELGRLTYFETVDP